MIDRTKRVPESIRVTVVHDDTGVPIPGITVLSYALMIVKNPHPLGPHVTDINGRVCYSRAAMVDEIEQTFQLFPNDYCHRMEDIWAIDVFSPGQGKVESLLKVRSEWAETGLMADLPKELRRAVEESRNGDYEPSTMRIYNWDFEDHMRLTMRLTAAT